MRIEFDPTNRDEATAVRAVLNAIHGPEWTEKVFSRRISVDGDSGPEIMLTDENIGSIPTREIETPWADTETTIHTGGEDLPVTDSTGEPHDPRIHSTPAKTNADGTWRAKRGVTAEQVAAVRAERNLTATDAELIEQAEPLEIAPAQEQSAPPAPNAPVGAPKPPGQSEAPFVPSVNAETNTTQMNSQSNGSEASDTGTVPSAGPVSFLDVMKAITAAQKAGKVDTAKVKELCAAIGAGDSTMGLNGADKGEHRQLFLQVLGLEPKERDAIIEAAQGEPGIDTVRALLGGA